MKKLKNCLHWFLSHLIRSLLLLLIRICFRPKLVYASEKAR